MKIFLLEDELMLQQSIAEYLEDIGHICISSASGQEALEIISNNSFDLLILDINVPDINGLELIEQLNQKEIDVKTLFISALNDIETIEKAYNCGAKDYIKKPFHLKELALRLQRVVESMADSKSSHIILSKNYSFSLEENKLFFKDKEELLTKRHLDIINCLCKNLNHIVTIDTIREYVWQSAVSDATIRSEISRLRKKLKEDFINNHKGIGYRVDRYINY